MKSDLIGYAMDFASFLMQKTRAEEKIRNIILFGSVSRSEAGRKSDVDIFVDLVREDPKLEKEFEKLLGGFMLSTKYKNYWKLLGIENEIKLTVGVLDNWKELKPSILSNGILLYGKFKTGMKSGKHVVFFIWENVKPNLKRVLFNKQLFGFKASNKFYLGLLQKYGGERIGKGCIAVPLDHYFIFHSLFKKYRIAVRIRKVLEY